LDDPRELGVLGQGVGVFPQLRQEGLKWVLLNGRRTGQVSADGRR